MSQAPTLPPIYANTPIELVSHQIIASFPANTFLENLAIASDGTIFVTNHEVGQILRLAPEGESSIFATIEGKATGIAIAPDGGLILTGWNAFRSLDYFLRDPKRCDRANRPVTRCHVSQWHYPSHVHSICQCRFLSGVYLAV